NPTGYAQVFEELDAGYTPTMTYTIGDDVLTQANDDDTEIRHLMYDGHGSTRLLTDDNGDIKATYAYDAYGNAEGFTASSAATKYLYAGEQYDANLGMTYLRGRYYLPTLGIFNRMDPFQGDPFAPQSLHKYAYCYNNPVNAIDPSGMLGIIGLTGSIALISLLSGVIAGAINKFVFGGSFSRTFVQVTAGSFLAMGMIAIYPPIAPWAWTIATFVVQTLWEWIVNGFDKPGESITRILFMTILTGFLGLGAKMFNVSQFTAFNADRLIHALGIRDVVGRIAIEVGKSTLKGLTVFAAIERIASALLDLWFELIGMPRRDLEREYRKAMG
ncbi:MAG: RHS repeat-associated core domain-containing protein, partial [Desulfobacteraceae bacterium]|nr:RHS repeat-associated core domain-containing protein [Desulfobacteraceae bacterium]